ncbi:unnamed protein product [Parnassius apollo]|uniref:(apollo) hypothetical protein n=1 Tax=Parnassius apollo TaxID=110799 RepID=A0A8S3X9S2_PARAO|nr:unnamed protein product [Parnassius apollo]
MISTRRIATQLGIKNMRMWRVLKQEGVHPYHFRRAENLREEDRKFHRRMRTDEATFTRTEITNHRNLHVWNYENPLAVRETSFQHEFSINMWAGTINDQIIWPFELPRLLTQENVMFFCAETCLFRFLQLDGAQAHYAASVRQFINKELSKLDWQKRSSSTVSRFTGLTLLDYYFWGYMEQKVHGVPIATREQLKHRIDAAATEIGGKPYGSAKNNSKNVI